MRSCPTCVPHRPVVTILSSSEGRAVERGGTCNRILDEIDAGSPRAIPTTTPPRTAPRGKPSRFTRRRRPKPSARRLSSTRSRTVCLFANAPRTNGREGRPWPQGQRAATRNAHRNMIEPGGKTTAQRHDIYIAVDQHALTVYFYISSSVDKDGLIVFRAMLIEVVLRYSRQPGLPATLRPH